MTPQGFFYKYNGQPIDFDGWYGDQCVDLIQQFHKEVSHGAFLSGATAIDIWNGAVPYQYERILNTPTNFPTTGDIPFFKFNHTAVIVIADVNSFTSFDQNFPTDPYGKGVCHFQEHSYNNSAGVPHVLGWWHKK